MCAALTFLDTGRIITILKLVIFIKVFRGLNAGIKMIVMQITNSYVSV